MVEKADKHLETNSMRPPFDPAMAAAMAKLPPEVFESVDSIRGQSDMFSVEGFLEKYPDLEHTGYSIPGPTENPEGSVILSVFKSKSSNNTKRPCIYNIHGGGQIAGTRMSGYEWICKWYDGMDVVHITVEYRYSPEYPAPAALYDCYAGLVWTAEHHTELGIDPDRILVQGGSGGAPMAAGCAILARNKKYPTLCAQLLSTPMLDDRCNSLSSQQYESHGPWDGRTNRMAWDCVLGARRGHPDVSELISPTRATDLRGVAPAFIDVGCAEVFRDDAVSYATSLWKSGVSTELHVWAGCFHGHELLAANTTVAKATTAAKRSWLQRILFDAGDQKETDAKVL